jgi:uncharacterized membrane protein YhaH (DUF805 family)
MKKEDLHWQDYCPDCIHFNINSRACSEIHFNIESRPSAFKKKCHGDFFQRNEDNSTSINEMENIDKKLRKKEDIIDKGFNKNATEKKENLFSINGRITTSTFWLRILTMASLMYFGKVYLNIQMDSWIRILCGIFFVTQLIKRLHDLNLSEGYGLIPFYNLYLTFLDGTHGRNRYGADPKGRDPEQSEVKNEPIVECQVTNFDHGDFSIKIIDNIELKPLDTVHLYFTCFAKTLFDLGDFEPIVTELIDNVKKSIQSSMSNSKFHEIDIFKLMKIIENYHRLDFDISHHLKITSFSQLEERLNTAPNFYSKYEVLNLYGTDINTWVTNSYYPLDFSKVYIPINIALLYNYIYKKYVFEDDFGQKIFKSVFDEFEAYTSESRYFYDISRLPETQGFIFGQIHSIREEILAHKYGI